MATEAFTQPQFSHEDCGHSAGRMTRVCPADPNATLSRAPEEMFVTQHVGHDNSESGNMHKFSDKKTQRLKNKTAMCL